MIEKLARTQSVAGEAMSDTYQKILNGQICSGEAANIVEELEAKLRESEAGAVTMRKAIDIFFHHWKHGGIRRDNQFHIQTAMHLKAAISSDAGKAILEELERLRAEVARKDEALRHYALASNWTRDDGFSVDGACQLQPWCRARAALSLRESSKP